MNEPIRLRFKAQAKGDCPATGLDLTVEDIATGRFIEVIESTIKPIRPGNIILATITVPVYELDIVARLENIVLPSSELMLQAKRIMRALEQGKSIQIHGEGRFY